MPTAKMRRWRVRAGRSGVEALFREDAAIPEPGPGEVRIRVHAVSLNRRDDMMLGGAYGRIAGRDLTPASDGSGLIDAVGDGVDPSVVGKPFVSLYFRNWPDGPPRTDMGLGLGAGDEDGMLADHVVLPYDRVVPAPASTDHAQAACLPCAALTGWNALHGRVPPAPGRTVLVQGTGGVALCAMALARRLGAEVVATTGGDAKRGRLEELGASAVFDHRDPEWGKQAFAGTGGVDIVVASAGWGALDPSLDALAPGGEVSCIGFLAESDAAPPDPYVLMGKGATIRGIAVGSRAMYRAMAQSVDERGTRFPVGARFDFQDAPDAFAALASPALFGKIVIDLT